METADELEVILRCLRAFTDEPFRPAPQQLPENLDPHRLSHLAIQEGVAGIVSVCLKGFQSDQLRRAVQATFVRGGAIWSEFHRLQADLEKACIPAVLLKGAALLATDYQRRLSLRPLSDIDLLIRPQDRPAVSELLIKHGSVPESRDSLVYFNRTLAVDLHLDLIGAQRIRSREKAYRMDLAAVWAASRPWPDSLKAHPGGFRLLSPEHQFLHLAVHSLKHSFSLLIWFVDLALTWRRVDPDLLVQQAFAFGMQRPLLYSLISLRDLLRIEPPRRLLADLPRPNRLEKLFLERVAQRRTDSLGALVQAVSVPGWRGRLAYLSESAFPQRRIMSRMFPQTPAWLAYPRRAGFLLRAGARELGKAVLE